MSHAKNFLAGLRQVSIFFLQNTRQLVLGYLVVKKTPRFDWDLFSVKHCDMPVIRFLLNGAEQN